MLVGMPPYSPELNPQEHIWNELRKEELPNRVFNDPDAAIRQWQSGLPRLCTDQRSIAKPDSLAMDRWAQFESKLEPDAAPLSYRGERTPPELDSNPFDIQLLQRTDRFFSFGIHPLAQDGATLHPGCELPGPWGECSAATCTAPLSVTPSRYAAASLRAAPAGECIGPCWFPILSPPILHQPVTSPQKKSRPLFSQSRCGTRTLVILHVTTVL